MDKLEEITADYLHPNAAAAVAGAIAAVIGHNKFVIRSIKPIHVMKQYSQNPVRSGGHSYRKWRS